MAYGVVGGSGVAVMCRHSIEGEGLKLNSKEARIDSVSIHLRAQLPLKFGWPHSKKRKGHDNLEPSIRIN